MAVGRDVVDCSNIDFVRVFGDQTLLKGLSVFEADVSAVDVAGECERELTLMEVGRVSAIVKTGKGLVVSLDHFAVAEPLEHQLVGEDGVVVDAEAIFIELELSSPVCSCG